MATTSEMDVTNAHVYSQRMLPEATALVALFHAQPAPRHEPVNLRRKASCLRKISAYNGGFPVMQDEDEASFIDSSFELSMGCGVAPYAKKRLSFADQHGGQLVLEREFHARDAPIYCNKAITHMIPSSVSTGQGGASARRNDSRSMVMERLLRAPGSSKQRGGRRGEEQKSGWSQPELLSLCVLSCSVVGYVVLNYARTLQST